MYNYIECKKNNHLFFTESKQRHFVTGAVYYTNGLSSNCC